MTLKKVLPNIILPKNKLFWSSGSVKTMLNLMEYTGVLSGVQPVRYCSSTPSPKPLLSSSSMSSPSSDGSCPSRLVVSNVNVAEESNSDGEVLDLTLPIRKRASNDNSQPSYKKSLIKRYCKSIESVVVFCFLVVYVFLSVFCVVLFLKSSVSLNFSQFIQYINRIGFEF